MDLCSSISFAYRDNQAVARARELVKAARENLKEAKELQETCKQKLDECTKKQNAWLLKFPIRTREELMQHATSMKNPSIEYFKNQFLAEVDVDNDIDEDEEDNGNGKKPGDLVHATSILKFCNTVLNPLWIKENRHRVQFMKEQADEILPQFGFPDFDEGFIIKFKGEIQNIVNYVQSSNFDWDGIEKSRLFKTRLEKKKRKYDDEDAVDDDWKKDVGEKATRIWEFWKPIAINDEKYPAFSLCLRLIVLIQVSSCAVERVFSQLKCVLVEEEEHFIGILDSGLSSPSSFVELEQSIYELEKCYAQCIKSSPQKGIEVRDGSKSPREEDGEMTLETKAALLERKEANQGNINYVNHGDHSRLACARVPLDLVNKQGEMIFQRQCLHQEEGEAASQNRSSITGYSVVPVSRHFEGNATITENCFKNISLPASGSDTITPNRSAQSTTMYRVSNDLDLEG